SQPSLAALLNGTQPGDQSTWSAIGDALAALFWPVPWLDEQIRFHVTLEQQFLRRTDYYLLTWEPHDVTPESIAAALSRATGRSVQRLERLEAVIGCDYEGEVRRLRPTQPGQPWLAVLDSCEFRGAITVEA